MADQKEPEWINLTGSRMLISDKNGASFWLNNGEKVKGERWRAYRQAGLTEVKDKTFQPAPPAPKASPAAPTKKGKAPRYTPSTITEKNINVPIDEIASLMPDQTNLGASSPKKSGD